MRSCPACGATAPADASWCGQCYARLEGAGGVAVPAQTAVAELAQVGAAPVTSTMTRFGLPAAGEPPVGYCAPPGYVLVPASYTAGDGPAEGSMLSRRAATLVAISIGVGVVAAIVSTVLARDDSLEPATYLRYALLLTLGVYGVVGALIVTRLVPGIRLRWYDGPPARAVLAGAGVGGAVSAALLALFSQLAGHLAPDPRIVTLMSEGDAPHIVVTIGITCLCAPLVEEILFRGLLLESMRWRSRSAALLISALCFAVWHLQIALIPLGYYTLMGLLLGSVYVKRGLAGSMAAHFAFNGVLSVAALAVVLSPGRTYSFEDVSIQAPSGWSQHDATKFSSGIALDGPSESVVLVLDVSTPVTVSTAALLHEFQSGAWRQYVPGVDATIQNVREVQLAAGQAVEADVLARGHTGNIVFVPEPSRLVEVVFISAGSDKAKADFPHILDSLRVG